MIDACLYLAVWADGRSIRTVEGESRYDTIITAVEKRMNDDVDP